MPLTDSDILAKVDALAPYERYLPELLAVAGQSISYSTIAACDRVMNVGDAKGRRLNGAVVCEKHDGTTSQSRLDAEEVRVWREFGSLGTLWMSGRLGGTALFSDALGTC